MSTGADSGGLDRASGSVEENELSMVMTLSYRATVDRAVDITKLAPTSSGNGSRSRQNWEPSPSSSHPSRPPKKPLR